MSKIAIIVEGQGEVEAAPLLVRRLLQEYLGRYEFQQFEAIRAKGNQDITKHGGLEAHLENASKIEACLGIIVLLDTEREHLDCPPNLAQNLAERAKKRNLNIPVVVVCAKCQYESWFLASLHTLKGKRGIPAKVEFEGDPENKCNAKQWLTDQMSPKDVYKETQDQPAMTALLDIPHLIKHSRSFRRMAHAVAELIEAIDQKKTTVTPLV